MALIHRATLRPSKLELVAGWAPGRPWGAAAAAADGAATLTGTWAGQDDPVLLATARRL